MFSGVGTSLLRGGILLLHGGIYLLRSGMKLLHDGIYLLRGGSYYLTDGRYLLPPDKTLRLNSEGLPIHILKSQTVTLKFNSTKKAVPISEAASIIIYLATNYFSKRASIAVT